MGRFVAAVRAFGCASVRCVRVLPSVGSSRFHKKLDLDPDLRELGNTPYIRSNPKPKATEAF